MARCKITWMHLTSASGQFTIYDAVRKRDDAGSSNGRYVSCHPR